MIVLMLVQDDSSWHKKPCGYLTHKIRAFGRDAIVAVGFGQMVVAALLLVKCLQ